MVLYSVVSQARKAVKSVYMQFIDDLEERRYGRAVIFGLLILIAGSASWGGYSMYVRHREQQASSDLMQYIKDYHQAAGAESTDWNYLANLFKMGYRQHSHSTLAPFFLLYQADALVQDNERQEALSLLDQALVALGVESPLYTTYAVKKALLVLEDNAQQGIADLQKLAQDKANKQRDMAQYYLGLYYWMHNDSAQAKVAWAELIDSQSAEKQERSAWALQAQQYMQQMS